MEISTANLCDPVGGAFLKGPGLSDNLPAPHSAVQWFAVQTRPRFEKKADAQLRRKGIETFLPLLKQVHRWSDRHKLVEVPLFAGYDFVHLQLSPETRLSVLQTHGVIDFVTFQRTAASVPDTQIESLQQVLDANLQCTIRPFLRTGQRVRIRGGALDGVEGILLQTVRRNLVISIECIQRSVAVEIEGYDLEVV
jgi:transcription antitermination factor NusG